MIYSLFKMILTVPNFRNAILLTLLSAAMLVLLKEYAYSIGDLEFYILSILAVLPVLKAVKLIEKRGLK